MLLYFICMFLCLQILNVSSQTISSYSHTNLGQYDFDVTTIYRITNMSTLNTINGGFRDFNFLTENEDKYSIEIHSRTNAIGMPIQGNTDVLQPCVYEIFTNGSFMYNNHNVNTSYDSEEWKPMSFRLNGSNCEDSRYYYYHNDHRRHFNTTRIPGISKSENIGDEECFTGLEYRYDNKGHHSYDIKEIFSFHLTPSRERTCLSLTYVHRSQSDFRVTMILTEENNTLFTRYLEKENNITTKKVFITLKKDRMYKLSLNSEFQYNSYSQYNGYDHLYSYTDIWFGLLRLALCSNYDEEEVKIVSSGSTTLYPKSYNIIGNKPTTSYGEIKETKSCLNGGFMLSLKSNCICPPGFTGKLCERGCGSNMYGTECNGICSMHQNRMCRGMLLCTHMYGCTCSPGLTGPLCNKDCESGKYGANCEQTCSENCHSQTCDRYTGVCSQGCSPGYVPPYCIQKYASLINPPQLIESNYETLKLMLNFEPRNMKGGYKNKMLKYFQLFYYESSNEEIIKSELKVVDKYNYHPTEILSDLKPDTEYMIGVMLITNDGNFNDQDIVYGHYKTSCLQPEITDYNVKLISGINSINITWNKIIPKRVECNVIQYVLTLTCNQLQNKISGVQEIIAISDSNHIISDLYPGYEYGIKLTPKTSEGPLSSSPTYFCTPLIMDSDIEIEDIVTKSINMIIKVTWNIKNRHQQNAIANKPVTCTVRYKINRLLSCSMDELENNKWTTVTVYNRTNYEIFNTVPNAQYCIQVNIGISDVDDMQRKNMVYEMTPTSVPAIEPVVDPEHPIYFTNNSVLFYWKFDHDNNCSKLHGFFSKYYIELSEKTDNIVQIHETKQNYVSFDNLKSNTVYELKVFIKTLDGYNPQTYLFTNFTTKFENLKAVDDLVVYKKSLNNRMVGLRWSHSENKSLNGFIVTFNENDFEGSKTSSVIAATKCPAWPEYYCHTFNNLSRSPNYKFKIKPRSLDYPEGGKESTVSFNSIDGLPDSPSNLKVNALSNTSVSLQWDIPWIFNGVLKMFVINLEEISAIDMNSCCVSTTPIEIPFGEEIPTYRYTITNLKPGSTYSIGVLTASKSSWYSSPARISVTTRLAEE